MHRMHVHPPYPPCASPPPPPGHVHPPPPQPERLVIRKDEAVGNKKKMQVCLPKHNYKLDNNLLTVEPGLWIRIVLMRIRIQLKILMRIRIQIRGGVGQPKMCIPPGKILGTPLTVPKSEY